MDYEIIEALQFYHDNKDLIDKVGVEKAIEVIRATNIIELLSNEE